MASEMLYPVLPIYLKSIGFSILFIGILEGVAEATTGLSKGFFGKQSDVSGKRLPFVQIGYALSAIAKPMMAFFVYPLWIFFARTIDRLGKGIRTGARDAILSDEAQTETKGRIFGFHRSMDTLGAVLGPLFALLYLYFYPEDYLSLFYIAFIPGLFAVFYTFRVKEPQALDTVRNVHTTTTFFSFLNYWKESTPDYRKVVSGLFFFSLFNSSDVFLLLKVKESGFSDSTVIGLYIFYNLVYALSAFKIGIIADRLGLKKMYLTGLSVFAIVYFSFSMIDSLNGFFALFLLYGLYAAATEGISKAWISNLCDKKDTATAIGTFSGFQTITTMLASSFAGIIWYSFGSDVTFLISGLGTFIAILYFLFFHKNALKSA
jgi:MFS family permease